MSSVEITDWMSAVVLTVIVGVPLLRFILHFRRLHYTWPQFPIYVLHIFYNRIIWRTTFSGPLPVVRGQGALIVSNHTSSIDPSFVQMATDRLAHWLVAREYFVVPAMAWAFRITGSISVRRGGVDIEATKLAIEYLKRGDMVGLFPEGRINTTGDVLIPGRPGVALIALKARVPVVPCYVVGAPYDGTVFSCFRMFARVHTEVGQPIDISEFYGRERERGVLEELTKRFLREMAKLAGVENYDPRVAGRNWNPQMGNGPAGPQPPARQAAGTES